jgi:hypothetical protein
MPAPDQPMFSPGVRLAGTPYRMIRLLGTGGMGEVYEAEHVELGVLRAVKVLTVNDAALGEGVARLRAEARALARLRHPNIVEAVDLGTSSDGHTYFAMELLEGITLRKLMTQGALAPAFAVHIVLCILDALEAAHRSDLVHRDVKPENVFLSRDGSVRLLDFGVAKWIAEDQALTRSGVLLGTPRYMAPEQLKGDPIDARADVYAAGVLLHELIAGRPPFEEERALALAYAHLSRPPPPLVSPQGPLPDGLVQAVGAAMAKEPRQRPATAAQLAAALRACPLGSLGDPRDAVARAVSGRGGEKIFGFGAVTITPASDAPGAGASYEHFVNVATVAAAAPKPRGRYAILGVTALLALAAGIAIVPGGRRLAARFAQPSSALAVVAPQEAPVAAAPPPVAMPSAAPATPPEPEAHADDTVARPAPAPSSKPRKKKAKPRAAAQVDADAGASMVAPVASSAPEEPGTATEEE